MSSQIQKYTINEILSLFTQSDVPEFLCDVSFLLVEESRPPIANYTRNVSSVTVAPKSANLKSTKSEPIRSEQHNSQSKAQDFSPKIISRQADKQNQKSTDFIPSFKPTPVASSNLNKTADSTIITQNMEKENDLETNHEDEVAQNQTNEQIYSSGPVFIPQNPDSFASNNPQDFVTQNQATFSPEKTEPTCPEFPPGFSIQDYNNNNSPIFSPNYSYSSQFASQNIEQSNQMPMQPPSSYFNPMSSSLNSENNKEQMDGFESVINTAPEKSKNASYSNKQEDYLYKMQSQQYIQQQQYQPQPFQQPQQYKSDQFQQPQPFQQQQQYKSEQFQQQQYKSEQFQQQPFQQPQQYKNDQFQQQLFQIPQPFQQQQAYQSDQFQQIQPFQMPQAYQPSQFQQRQQFQQPQSYQSDQFQQQQPYQMSHSYQPEQPENCQPPESYKQSQPEREQQQQIPQKTQHKQINFQQIYNNESHANNNQKKNENKPRNSFSPDTVVEDVKNVKIAPWGNVKSKASQQSFQEIEKSAKSDEKAHHNASKPMIISSSASSANQKKASTKMTINNIPNNKNEGTKGKKGNRSNYTSRPIEIPKPSNFTVDNIAISQLPNAGFQPNPSVVYNISQHNNNNSNTQTQNSGRPKGLTITIQNNNNSNKPAAFNPGNIAIPPSFTPS